MKRDRLFGIAALAVIGIAGAVALARHDARTLLRNVVMITLDTTRADRLPAYGFDGVRTPAIDRLAREGVVFDNAATVAPLTLPAHTSLFTGNLPFRHGLRDNAAGLLPASQLTLAERLHARGWQTAAFVGSIVLAPGRGLERGFDRYVAPAQACPEVPARRRGDAVVTDALDWLKQARDGRFFLWIHLYDAHRPYDLPEARQDEYARTPYLAALSYLDEQVGRVLTALDREGLAATTAVVIAGDHGEGLGDHGEQSHGIFVYQSVLHVPLMMRIPGVAARRVPAPVSVVDVRSTLLDLAGYRTTGTDGVSLAREMRGRGAPREREVYAESLYPERFGWSRLRSVRDGRYKLIAAPRPELYDLANDPLERRNLFDARRSLAAAMLRRLERYEDVRTSDAATAPALDEATTDALASLGYVGNGPPGASNSPAVHGNAVDPKDRIALYEQLTRARRAPRRQACRATPTRL